MSDVDVLKLLLPFVQREYYCISPCPARHIGLCTCNCGLTKLLQHLWDSNFPVDHIIGEINGSKQLDT